MHSVRACVTVSYLCVIIIHSSIYTCICFVRVRAMELALEKGGMGDHAVSERLTALCEEFCNGLSSQNVPRILAKGMCTHCGLQCIANDFIYVISWANIRLVCV